MVFCNIFEYLQEIFMNILYQCNDKYAPYCGVSITSLFENNKEAKSICVFILEDEIKDENKEKFNSLAKKYGREIHFISTERLIQKMKDLGIAPYRGSYTANFKMFINEYIPDDVDRLLYIDSDTIVDGGLTDLFSVDMGGKPIGMCMDSLVGEYKKCIGMENVEKYYNSGVLFFDVKEWKNQKCSENIVEHTKTVRAHYPAPDQDLINLTVREDIVQLPIKYNMEPAVYMFDLKNYLKTFNHPYYSVEDIEEAKKNVVIYHFFRVMGEFPWHKNNLHPFNELFDKYLSISPWSGYEKNESGISFVFKIEKLLYKFLPEQIFIRLFKMSHEYFMKKSNKMSLQNEINKLM